jgi:hypothetical protein
LRQAKILTFLDLKTGKSDFFKILRALSFMFAFCDPEAGMRVVHFGPLLQIDHAMISVVFPWQNIEFLKNAWPYLNSEDSDRFWSS